MAAASVETATFDSRRDTSGVDTTVRGADNQTLSITTPDAPECAWRLVGGSRVGTTCQRPLRAILKQALAQSPWSRQPVTRHNLPRLPRIRFDTHWRSGFGIHSSEATTVNSDAGEKVSPQGGNSFARSYIWSVFISCYSHF